MEDDQAFQRQDSCLGCVGIIEDERHILCSWETQYTDPAVLEAERQESFSPLRRLFYDLAATTDRSGIAQAFLCAQLLKRQKAFRQIRESEDGDDNSRVTLFLDKMTSRLIETRDLNFSYAEMDDARALLMEKLRLLESPEEEEAPAEGQEQEAPVEGQEQEAPAEGQEEEVPAEGQEEVAVQAEDEAAAVNESVEIGAEEKDVDSHAQ